MNQLLQIDDRLAVDTFVSLGQVVVAPVHVDCLLDLMRVELLVGKDGLVVADGAENAIATKRNDALIVNLEGLQKVVDTKGLLDEVGFSLGKEG